jgi:hypothetical protein
MIMTDQSGSIKGTERSSRNVRTLLAQCLSTCAILIALSNSIAFLFALFPVKLLDPFWQLGFCAAILTTSVPIVVSFLFAFAALALSPGNEELKARSRVIAKISSALALVLLLVIPLQLYSGLKALRAKTRDILQEASKLKAIARGLEGTRSEQELRFYVASLPNAPRLPDKFEVPFAEVKRRVLVNLQSIVNKSTNDADTQKTAGMQTFLLEATRNSLQCLLLSTAFAVIASFRTRSIGIFQIIILRLLRL